MSQEIEVGFESFSDSKYTGYLFRIHLLSGVQRMLFLMAGEFDGVGFLKVR